MAQTQHKEDSASPDPPEEPVRPGASVPGQRGPQDRTDGPATGPAEVVVRLDLSDAALDRVVVAARHAAVGGMPLRLLPATGDASPVARERMDQQLAVAAELAHAVAPDVEVHVGHDPA
jgi:hypothetical protein